MKAIVGSKPAKKVVKNSDDVKKTTIAPTAAQVSTENCPCIIKTVAKYLFDVDIPLSSLPSERTVRRYADQGHVLAKIQDAEAVVSNTFDIHSDGTTRNKRKYIGYQVTTSVVGLQQLLQKIHQPLSKLP